MFLIVGGENNKLATHEASIRETQAAHEME